MNSPFPFSEVESKANAGFICSVLGPNLLRGNQARDVCLSIFQYLGRRGERDKEIKKGRGRDGMQGRNKRAKRREMVRCSKQVKRYEKSQTSPPTPRRPLKKKRKKKERRKRRGKKARKKEVHNKFKGIIVVLWVIVKGRHISKTLPLPPMLR